MFKKVLVANRGEIACRVFRACRALGVRSVAVFSEADADWPHVREADEAVAIGPAPPRESYLNGPRLIEVARSSGVEAIHPGYGFLSENWEFARAVEEAGLVFIGPPWSVIRRMGEKTEARRLMAASGIPVMEGSEVVADLEEAQRKAERIGYPLMLKAAAGGGGIGMARVDTPSRLAQALASAERRVQSAFGVTTLYLERYLLAPRHVEVQVFGDQHGTLLHLYERDCSLQRRRQKLVEESPAPGLDPELKRRLTESAVKGARAAGYVNAGTMEFLLDQAGAFYFLEMNARLQVEHPVTEEVTGLDLVRAQLMVAAGERLPWTQEAILQRGAAIECRIYAEDPARNFMPSPGTIAALKLPRGEGIRVECGVAEGVTVSVHYDPLLAKLIARGESRAEAIDRMARALEQFQVEGVKTTLPFHRAVMAHAAFRRGQVHTQMVEQGAFNAA